MQRHLTKFRKDLFYQPEKHYMRGPGPKWRQKHLGEALCATDSGPYRR